MTLGSTIRQALDQSYGDMAGSEQQHSSVMAGSEQQHSSVMAGSEQLHSSAMAGTTAAVSPSSHGYIRGCNQMCGSKFEGCLLPTVVLRSLESLIDDHFWMVFLVF